MLAQLESKILDLQNQIQTTQAQILQQIQPKTYLLLLDFDNAIFAFFLAL